MAVYGYIRKDAPTSFMTQLELVQQHNCDEIFVEDASFKMDDELQRLLAMLENGKDTLVVVSLSAFGKSMRKTRELFNRLHDTGTRFVSIEDHIDTDKLGFSFYEIASAFQNMDYFYHAHNTQEGLKKAKAKGIVGGRPRVSKDTVEKIVFLYENKDYSIQQIAEVCSVSIGTVHKYLKANSSL